MSNRRDFKGFKKQSQVEQINGLAAKVLLDRFGRVLGQGDIVHIMGKHDIMWKVMEIKPVFNPNQPPGMMQLVLHTQLLVGVPTGQPISDLIKLLENEETPPEQPAEAGQPEDQPNPGTEGQPVADPGIVQGPRVVD